MNGDERRIRAATAAKAAGEIQQECQCGWLAPRVVSVEMIGDEKAPERITMMIVCPVCGARFSRNVGRSATC